MKLYVNLEKKKRFLLLTPDSKYLSTKGTKSYHKNNIKKTKILKYQLLDEKVFLRSCH